MKKIIPIVILLGVATWALWPEPNPIGGPIIEPIEQVAPSYFAQIDDNGTIVNVIVASQEMINTGKLGDPKYFIPTAMEDGYKLHAATIGSLYLKDEDVFLPPKPMTASATPDLVNKKWVVETKATSTKPK